jgi:hypothetical protein
MLPVLLLWVRGTGVGQVRVALRPAGLFRKRGSGGEEQKGAEHPSRCLFLRLGCLDVDRGIHTAKWRQVSHLHLLQGALDLCALLWNEALFDGSICISNLLGSVVSETRSHGFGCRPRMNQWIPPPLHAAYFQDRFVWCRHGGGAAKASPLNPPRGALVSPSWATPGFAVRSAEP